MPDVGPGEELNMYDFIPPSTAKKLEKDHTARRLQKPVPTVSDEAYSPPPSPYGGIPLAVLPVEFDTSSERAEAEAFTKKVADGKNFEELEQVLPNDRKLSGRSTSTSVRRNS